ncbi:MAG: histidine phosphatase family protein [Polyangiaceae bacterium]|nr:histidine phosphatase family protein [Polyangiaceae bacterium]
MSLLILVRHGQASFLSDDYDRLSERGEAQARHVGAWLRRTGVVPTSVFAGPRLRQRETARLALLELGASTAVAPLDELDEHHAGALLSEHLPAVAAASPDLARHAAAFASAGAERARYAELMLRDAMALWREGHPATGGVESFSAFRARARRALERLTASDARGQTVLAFTSGGTIGAIVGAVLEVADQHALELGFASENASCTEIAFSGARRSLRRLGVSPELPAALRTMR